MNYCPRCGAKIDHTGKFCQACGQALTSEPAPTPNFKQSFSYFKKLSPSRENLNRVIGFMHANFFLIHAIYLAIFIIALFSPWTGFWSLVLAAILIYLYGAFKSSAENEWNQKIKEIILAVGENRPIEAKKEAPQETTVVPEAEDFTEVAATEPDTFDQLDVAADFPVTEELDEAELLASLEEEIPSDTEEIDELAALYELEQIENQETLDELEQLDESHVVVAPAGEAEIVLETEEAPKD